jgi:hypothetical protein
MKIVKTDTGRPPRYGDSRNSFGYNISSEEAAGSVKAVDTMDGAVALPRSEGLNDTFTGRNKNIF